MTVLPRAVRRLRSPAVATGAALALTVGVLAAWPHADAGVHRAHVTHYSPTGTYADGSPLVSGRLITPMGRRTTVGNSPVAMALSPDKKTLAVIDSGQGQGGPQQTDEALQLVSVRTGRVLQTVRDHEAGAPTFYESGVVWSPDGRHLYATGGGNDQVYDYAVTGGKLKLAQRWKSSLRAGAPTVPGTRIGGIPGTAPVVGDVASYSRGLTVLPDGSAVLVTNEQGSTVASLSTTDGTLQWETALAGAGQAGGGYPEAVVVHGSTAYVVDQGLNAVTGLNTATGVITSTTPVGDHPVAAALGSRGRQLYVVNANDDSLSVLDLTGAVPTVVATRTTHLVDHEANGSTPNAVAVDDQHHRVYVTNAGDNVVEVFQAGRGKKGHRHVIDPALLHREGAVPTGWYPDAVTVTSGNHIVVASAKGLGGSPVTSHEQYIVNKNPGLLTTVAIPRRHVPGAWTRKAQRNLRYPSTTTTLRPKNSPIPLPAHAGQSPIKHVVLIVRENRTFDQVFGDLKRKGANVQKTYLEYGEHDAMGRTITPNAHALADRFALSQNFYSDGEASIQGHNWTSEGVSTDYTEKSYLHYYSDRNHPYDPTAGIVYPRCGAMFQQLAAQGKTFRNFGELVGLSTVQTPTTKVAPGSTCATPGGTYDAASAANFDNNLGANLSLTSVSDVDKEQEIESVLNPLVTAGNLPQFTYAVLGNDHTDGTASGKLTPQAQVARNDQAIGKFVDYISHTPDWKSTAVFIVEDDSQDGLDHVDGHRNILLVASPYAKPHALSNLHIDQASVLHTIELILGLKPISSYTQFAATPYDLFTSKPDLRPYSAIVPTYPTDAMNPAAAKGSPASVPLDLSQVDLAGPMLEAQDWAATHPGEPMPPLLIAELRAAGGIRPEALTAWAAGRDCDCTPLLPGLPFAPGYGLGALDN